MSYTPTHKDSECDKCLEDVGRENLKPAPFLYLDRNDQVHKDAVPDNPRYKDYKQYYICKGCKP